MVKVRPPARLSTHPTRSIQGTTEVETTGRDAVLVEDAARIRMMGLPVLEALPARGVPYELSDPFILLHESRFRLSELSGMDTKYPHRGFDNLWYIL
jgi:hypothetical protein